MDAVRDYVHSLVPGAIGAIVWFFIAGLIGFVFAWSIQLVAARAGKHSATSFAKWWAVGGFGLWAFGIFAVTAIRFAWMVWGGTSNYAG